MIPGDTDNPPGGEQDQPLSRALKGESVTKSKSSDDVAERKDISDVRSMVGGGVASFSDFVNDNLIVVRYGVYASIGLMAAYGISQTPLFFRYRTVSEIPSSYFTRRKSLVGRIIKVQEQKHDTNGMEPIVLYIRHLSPVERLLSRAAFEGLMNFHPAKAFARSQKPEESPQELLKVQIAGIQSPPQKPTTNLLSQYSTSESPGEWLNKLAKERRVIRCQFLARKVPFNNKNNSQNGTNVSFNRFDYTQDRIAKRPIPNLEQVDGEELSLSNNALSSKSNNNEDRLKQVALAKIFYRSKPIQLFRSTDLGESMVRFGRASISDDEEGLYPHTQDERIVDVTTSVKDLQKDVTYLEMLSNAELEAAKGWYGMWADESFRDSRKDVVEEVEFQEKASIWKKAWRWFRGE